MAETEVLYNDSCPVCRREVQHYQRLSTRAGLPIAYDKLGDADRLADWGLAPDAAAERLHLRRNGRIYAGIPAFIILWQRIPQYRWLARLLGLPGLHGLACATYDHVLAPFLFRWHKRREARHQREN